MSLYSTGECGHAFELGVKCPQCFHNKREAELAELRERLKIAQDALEWEERNELRSALSESQAEVEALRDEGLQRFLFTPAERAQLSESQARVRHYEKALAKFARYDIDPKYLCSPANEYAKEAREALGSFPAQGNEQLEAVREVQRTGVLLLTALAPFRVELRSTLGFTITCVTEALAALDKAFGKAHDDKR